MLADKGQHEVVRHRRDPVEAGFAELALDVVFLGEGKPAMGLHAHVGGLPRCFGGEVFCHVGFRPGAPAAFVDLGGFFDHQVRRFGRHVGFGDGELDALVLADLAAEDLAVIGIIGRLLDEPARVADALGGDQDALGVHAVEDIAEALALFADQRIGGITRSSKKTSVVRG